MPEKRSDARWYWLFALPFVALLLPGFYAHESPVVLGFPFFYWYQFAWVILSALITGFVFSKTRAR
jgi:hypothetical protein